MATVSLAGSVPSEAARTLGHPGKTRGRGLVGEFDLADREALEWFRVLFPRRRDRARDDDVADAVEGGDGAEFVRVAAVRGRPADENGQLGVFAWSRIGDTEHVRVVGDRQRTFVARLNLMEEDVVDLWGDVGGCIFGQCNPWRDVVGGGNCLVFGPPRSRGRLGPVR